MLQNAHHAHHEDMRAIVTGIVNEDTYGGRPPNWRRKNVRKRISERVSFQENNGFRPIGPKTGHEVGGGNRQPTFDTDAFSFEFPDSLHTIPADDGRSEGYTRLGTLRQIPGLDLRGPGVEPAAVPRHQGGQRPGRHVRVR